MSAPSDDDFEEDGLVHVASQGQLPALYDAAAARAAFEQAAEQVIAAKRSQHTRAAYRSDFASWLWFCDRTGFDPIRASLAASAAFRDELLRHRQAGGVRRVCASLSSIYKTLLQGGVAKNNCFHPALLAWPSANSFTPTPPMLDADADALIAACRRDPDRYLGMRDEAILAILHGTGLRRASVATMMREGIRHEGSTTMVRVQLKGGASKEKELPESAAVALRIWLARSPEVMRGPVFPGRGEGAIEPGSLNKILDRRAEQAGCAGRAAPHRYRSAFATAGYDAAADGQTTEREIQQALDHASPELTRRYDRGQRGGRAVAAVAARRRGTKAKAG